MNIRPIGLSYKNFAKLFEYTIKMSNAYNDMADNKMSNI